MLNSNIYGRPFDDLRDKVIFSQALACYNIFALAHLESLNIITSDVLFAEIELISDKSKRDAVHSLAKGTQTERVSLNDTIIDLADGVHTKISDYMDCLHIAFCAYSGSSHLITCDNELINKARSIEKLLSMRGYILRIIGPVQFLAEVSEI